MVRKKQEDNENPFKNLPLKKSDTKSHFASLVFAKIQCFFGLYNKYDRKKSQYNFSYHLLYFSELEIWIWFYTPAKRQYITDT